MVICHFYIKLKLKSPNISSNYYELNIRFPLFPNRFSFNFYYNFLRVIFQVPRSSLISPDYHKETGNTLPAEYHFREMKDLKNRLLANNIVVMF